MSTSRTDHDQVGPGVLKRHSNEVSLFQRIADGVIVVLAHFGMIIAYGEPWLPYHTRATAIAIAVFYVSAGVMGLYRSWRGSPLKSEVRLALGAWTATVPVLLLIGFATKTSAEYSRVVVLGWFLATPVGLSLWRVAVRRILRAARARGHNTRTVGIAGSTEIGKRLAQKIVADPTLGLRLQGVYDDRGRRRHEVPESVGNYGGNLQDLVEAARSGVVDIVYLALPLRAEQRITSLVRALADTTATVYVVPDFHAYDLLHARWGSLGDLPVVSIFDTPLDGLGGWMKRLEDLILGTAILCIVALPMLAVAIAIKLDSKGPVLFRQRRYGLNGKAIRVWKFRTMSVVEDGAEIKQTQKSDPRITRIGGFLRKWSVDELPQFFNVMTGEMSIVGPRPHAVAHNELYRAKIHGYMLRHKVKPGITGWAQVNGWRGETDTVEKMERRIEHDLYYINNWGLFWDLKIIFLTVFGRSVHQNAY